MFDVDTRGWKQKNERHTEDNLLYEYCRKFGGVTFTEVPFGDTKEPKKARRIDAVRFRKHTATRRIVKYEREEFERRLSSAARKGEKVEVIEVKGKLNRSVIGQVIVANYWFGDKDQNVRPEKVIICGEEVKVLKKFCSKHDIRVWIPKQEALDWIKKLQREARAGNRAV